MPLFKIAFWLVIIVLLLPSGRDQQPNAYVVAHATMRDLGRFCERNPDTCEQGGAILSSLVDKATVGGKMLVSFIKDRVSTRYADYGAGGTANWNQSAAEYRPSSLTPNRMWARGRRNTLTDQDLEPEWTAPINRPMRSRSL